MKYMWLQVVAVMVLLAGCSGIKVVQDYDPASDFRGLTTFRWESETQERTGDTRLDNPLRDERTRAAMERVLQEKGFKKITEGTPTFFVRYQYNLRKQIETTGTSTSFGLGVGRSRHYGGIALGTGGDVSTYYEEALTIDFLGADSESLLWRGTGEQRYAEYKDPTKNIRSTTALVEKILDQFPPD